MNEETEKKKSKSALPPFLQKLKTIASRVDSNIADWAEDGKSYVVKDNDQFEIVLKQHFKGSLQTFIRQLHFYGFRKLDVQNGGWSFTHKNFRKDAPHLLLEIKRRTRSDVVGSAQAAQQEVQNLRSQVATLTGTVESLRTQLDSVLGLLHDAGVSVGTSSTPSSSTAQKLQRKRPRVEQNVDVQDVQQNIDEVFAALAAQVEPLPLDTTSMADTEIPELFDLPDLKEPTTFETLDGQLGADMIKNYPENLAVELEADAQTLSGANKIAQKVANHPEKSNVSDAKLVADETKLDPASVQKVLTFLYKVASKAGGSQNQKPMVTRELLSDPHIQTAINNFKKFGELSLATQEVGAN